jgi:ABC-type transport system involved in cytochrome c biogenesis permease subunit
MEQPVHNPKAGYNMGIVALVLGIIGLLGSWIPCLNIFSVFFSVVAIILGAIAYSQAKKGNASTTMPIIALILGVVGTIITIVMYLFVAASINENADEIQKAMDSVKIALDTANVQMDTTAVYKDSIQ